MEFSCRPEFKDLYPSQIVATLAENGVYITWLKSDVSGIYFYLYPVVDIWSQMVVHWEIHERESSELASRMLQKLSAFFYQSRAISRRKFGYLGWN